MKKYTQYDDLYLENIDNDLELLIKSETDIEELRLLKREAVLLDKIYNSENTIQELTSRKEYIINNKKYSLIERGGVNFNILINYIKNLYFNDDLRVTESELKRVRKTR